MPNPTEYGNEVGIIVGRIDMKFIEDILLHSNDLSYETKKTLLKWYGDAAMLKYVSCKDKTDHLGLIVAHPTPVTL